ncbi:MAG: hemolysin family protein [Chloroflexi bacterium]|nr:hemolysin family protein [Chloroflexota bacterium]MCI0579527.1 hemolysin family protein [Chloroflexota bacterium]MCI0644433.1 hemolysin family protein [Chloroflexota bacterium]MCI0725402.1 hemolysin family protein [Chloroflexota bacterium]
MSRLLLLLLVFPALAVWSATQAAEELPGLGTLLLPFIVIIILVLLNGFYVAAEFAIIGVRPSQVEQMVQEGNRPARQVLAVLDSPARQDRYIATAQLGITIASLGLGMYGEPQIAHFVEAYLAEFTELPPHAAVIQTAGSVVGLGLLTYLHIVIGEMVPKSLSLASADRSVLWVARPMRLSELIFAVPVRALNWVGRLLLHLFKIPPAEGEARLHSPEELELIVSESAEGGLLHEEEEEMIRNIFDFSDRQVGQVMTPRTRVQAIPYDMPHEELLELVTESRQTRFPVYEGDLDHVIGILHLKDLVRQQLRSRGSFDLRLLLRPAPAVPENQSVERLLAAFKRQRIHMAIVLDEFGGVAGIVTLEDLVEEIVGEVRDEFDQEKEPVVELAPGVLEVAGNFLVDDLSEFVFLGEEEELPDVETVGGLIHTWLGRPPKVGDRVKPRHNPAVTMTVLDVDGLAVARAKVEFPVHVEEAEREQE